MKKLLRNKKGITLLETIVGVVIFAILGLMVAQVFTTTSSNSQAVQKDSEYTLIVDTVAQTLTKDLEAASMVKIDNNLVDPNIENSDRIKGRNLQINFASGNKFNRTYANTEDHEYALNLLVSSGTNRNVLEKEFYNNLGVNITYEYETTSDTVTVFLNIDVVDPADSGAVLFSRQVAVRPPALQPKQGIKKGAEVAWLYLYYNDDKTGMSNKEVSVQLDGNQPIELIDLEGEGINLGFDFNGWRIDSGELVIDGYPEYHAGDTIIGSLGKISYRTDESKKFVLYLAADWTPHSYDITYHPNGGTPDQPTTPPSYECAKNNNFEGEIYTRVETDKYDNTITWPWKLLGWSRDKDSKTAEYKPGEAIPKNGPFIKDAEIDLYAIWEEPTIPETSYNITFMWKNYKTKQEIEFKNSKMENKEKGTYYLPQFDDNQKVEEITKYKISSWAVRTTNNYEADIEVSDDYKKFSVDGPYSATPVNITIVMTLEKEEYELILHTNGGVFNPAPNGSDYDETNSTYTVKFKWGEKPTIPVDDELTQAGHTFNGWVGSGGNVSIDIRTNDTYEQSGNIHAYADWTTKQYTVAFYNGINGKGSVIGDPFDIEYGSKIPSEKIPPDQERPGYGFNGWGDASGNAFNFDDPITDHTNVIAQWTTNYHKLTLYGQGGKFSQVPSGYRAISPDSDIYINENVTYNGITLPTDITYTGKKFEGWYTAADGGDPITEFKNVTGEVVAYAHWTDIVYIIKFYDNTGDGTVNQPGNLVATYKVPYGQTMKQSLDIPSNPKAVSGNPTVMPSDSSMKPTNKTHYTFSNWYTDPGASGGSVWSDTGTINSDKTYYARWKKVNYTVTFHTGDATMDTATYTFKERVGNDNRYTKDYTALTSPALNKNLISRFPDLTTFVSWVNGDGTVISSIPTIDGNKDVYLRLRDAQYKVTYDGNGITSGSKTAQTFSKDAVFNEAQGGFARTNWVFLGWSKIQTESSTPHSPAKCDFIPNDTAHNPKKGNVHMDTAQFYGGDWTSAGVKPLNINAGSDISVTLYAVWAYKGIITDDGWWYGKEDDVPDQPMITITYYIPQGASLANPQGVTLSGPVEHYQYGTNNKGEYYTQTIPKAVGTYTIPVTAAFNGFTWNGWSDSVGGTGKTTITIGAGTPDNIELFARWKDKKINYYANNGDSNADSKPQTLTVVDYADSANLPKFLTIGKAEGQADFSKQGNEFLNWGNSTSPTKTYNAGTDIAWSSLFGTAEEVNLYAQWNTKKYLIIYQVPNGTISTLGQKAQQGATYSSTDVIPNSITQPSVRTRIAQEIASKTYNSFTDENGATWHFGYYEYGKTEVPTNNVTGNNITNHDKFKFSAWNGAPTSTQTETVHVKATWSKFTIKYKNGDEDVGTQDIEPSGDGKYSLQRIKTVNDGVKSTSGDISKTKTGHRFKEWKHSNGSTYKANQEITSLEGLFGNNTEITLTADWSPLTYVVVFQINSNIGGITTTSNTYTPNLTEGITKIFDLNDLDFINTGFPGSLVSDKSPFKSDGSGGAMVESKDYANGDEPPRYYIAWYTYSDTIDSTLPDIVFIEGEQKKSYKFDGWKISKDEFLAKIQSGTTGVIHLTAQMSDKDGSLI